MIWPFNFEARRRARREAGLAALRRAMVGYPLYDPPHKVEERLLPADKAEENFDYFMSVRQQRLQHFRDWMKTQFGWDIPLDRTGVVALCEWLDRHGEFLFATHDMLDSYFYYDKPWVDDCVGSNVVFDIATFLGEALIARYPKLYWSEYPYDKSELREVEKLRKEKGTGFHRPQVTGFINLLSHWNPFMDVGNFVSSCIMFATLEHLIAQKRYLSSKRWNHIKFGLVGHYDRYCWGYDTRQLATGIAPREGFDA